MRIEKKVWSEYFQKILDGIKTYELRLADFQCNPGDILILKEWNPKTKQFTGRVIEKEITYVLKTKELAFWSSKEIEEYGYQIISFR
jgi:ribosomal protein S17